MERRLWSQGCCSWQQAVLPSCASLSVLHKGRLAEALSALEQGRVPLLRALPPAEHWRALCVSGAGVTGRPSRWLALDIETSSCGPGTNDITVIGVCGHATGFAPRAFVNDRHEWAEGLAELLQATDVLVSFAGRGFDVPLVRGVFPEFVFPPYHVDLFPTYRRLGLGGGLKRLQEQLGFGRTPELRGLDGFSAVLLWKNYLETGRDELVKTLVRYCLEDVVVLLPMAAEAYDRLAVDAGRDWRCWQPPSVSLDGFPFDPAVVRRYSHRKHR